MPRTSARARACRVVHSTPAYGSLDTTDQDALHVCRPCVLRNSGTGRLRSRVSGSVLRGFWGSRRRSGGVANSEHWIRGLGGSVVGLVRLGVFVCSVLLGASRFRARLWGIRRHCGGCGCGCGCARRISEIVCCDTCLSQSVPWEARAECLRAWRAGLGRPSLVGWWLGDRMPEHLSGLERPLEIFDERL
ncbi:hypothetical protein C7974DRAFT_394991 [Boeremia exigua]|uniref:uncharacterized protein n=1 Tax=Boeremia exigua TaxID=749465 RepID=UPI001E8EA862|nr:uncharacterized protein C7974DRAFT_394991 [Boeremia exigua]KAH6629681.1 hypothetical protein C7974DRAFT_394991 [Boeremia exigua]